LDKQEKLYRNLKTRFWYAEVVRSAGARNPYGLNKVFDSEIDKVWYKYKAGDRNPTKATLNEVDARFNGTKEAFLSGPQQIFKIFESKSVNDAAKIIGSEIEIQLSKDEISICETPFVHDGGPSATYLHDLIPMLITRWRAYGLTDLTPLIFAVAHTESRLMTNPDALIKVVEGSLIYFKERHGIPFAAWAFNKEVCYALKALRLSEVFNMKMAGKEIDMSTSVLKMLEEIVGVQK
jgi:hypothetical protein